MSDNAIEISTEQTGDYGVSIYVGGIADYPAFLAQIDVTAQLEVGGSATIFVYTFEVGGNMVSPDLNQLKAQVSFRQFGKVKSCTAKAFYWSANQIAESADRNFS